MISNSVLDELIQVKAMLREARVALMSIPIHDDDVDVEAIRTAAVERIDLMLGAASVPVGCTCKSGTAVHTDDCAYYEGPTYGG